MNLILLRPDQADVLESRAGILTSSSEVRISSTAFCSAGSEPKALERAPTNPERVARPLRTSWRYLLRLSHAVLGPSPCPFVKPSQVFGVGMATRRSRDLELDLPPSSAFAGSMGGTVQKQVMDTCSSSPAAAPPLSASSAIVRLRSTYKRISCGTKWLLRPMIVE